MPPRRRIQAEEPSSANISCLSDDLLAKCFAPLNQRTRLCKAALVCKKWHAVSAWPELQRKVEFVYDGYDDGDDPDAAAAALLRLQHFLAWLHLHGHSVRYLAIHLLLEDKHISDAEREGLASGVESCIALCAASLEHFSLESLSLNHTLGASTASASHLQRLSLCVGDLAVLNTLEHLTSLQYLAVGADKWQMGPAVRLPSSLTRVNISYQDTEAIPSQVAALTNLRSLSLEHVQYSAGGTASLTRLTSLQHAFCRMCKLPDSLLELTGLRVLQISGFDNFAAFTASLDSALRQLTQLTGLWLEELPAAFGVPACITALRSLQWLYFWPRATTPGQAQAVLPLGPWQRSLCHLATPFEVARHNLSFLSGAERLQRLSFLEPPAMQAAFVQQWHAFWRWAAQHAVLQSIDFGTDRKVDRELVRAMLQLQTLRPALQIDPGRFNSSLLVELLGEWHRTFY